MKFKTFTIFIAVLLLSSSMAFGQGHFSLGSVSNEVSPGVLPVGEEITFTMHLTNDATANGGVTNGFSIASPDGAEWTSMTGDTIAGYGWDSWFDLIFSVLPINTDGVGADTMGFGGSRLFAGTGIPANFDGDVYTLTIGPIDASHGGKTIVLDSCAYSASGLWKWASPDEIPTWGGPYTFTVEGGNAAPVLDPIGAQSTDEGVELAFSVSASDGDGDPITLTTSTLPNGASFIDNGNGTGDFSWTPTSEQSGSYDITFTASDGTATDDEVVTITVNDVNLPPVLVDLTDQSVDEGQLLTIDVDATDPEGADLLYTVSPMPITFPNTSFNVATGEFTFTPDFTQSGVYEFIFSVSDGVHTVSDTINITVNNVNRAPNLNTITNQSVDEGVNLAFTISGTDPDGDALSYGAETLPSGASIDAAGNFSWTPTFDQADNYNVNFFVTDGLDSAFQLITITVNDVNRAPILAPIGAQFVTAGGTLNFDVTATDPDGTIPALTTSALPAGATFMDNGDGSGTFDWTTDIAASGSFDVTFTASDGDLTDEELVTITIGDAPKQLVATPDSIVVTYTEGDFGDTTVLHITELNDFNIAFSEVHMYDWGWMDLSGFAGGTTPDSVKVFTNPAGLAPGMYFDSVKFASPEATDTLTVLVYMYVEERPNTAPVLEVPTDSLFLTDECTPLDIAFLAADNEGDAISMMMDGLVANMTFTDNGDGSADFNFAPNFSQAGVYNLTLHVADFRDTSMYNFIVTVEECEPGTEGDTVTVHTVPAVPGAQVVVPVDFANLCMLWSYNVPLSFDSDYLTLDSISYADSRVELWSDLDSIDNVNGLLTLSRGWAEADRQSPGSGNMVNLHFSLEVGTPAGFYPLDITADPNYERDCGGGIENVRPFFIPGGIVVDTSGNYVCGYVVDPDGNPIPGAMVQLWDDFPSGASEMETMASGTGVFAFADFTTIPYDLYAYSPGYYPNSVENINFAQSGIMIELTPVQPIAAATNTWVDFYCGANTYRGYDLPIGAIVEAIDPDGVKCGEFMVTTAGEYGFMHVYGDDEFADGDQGAVAGDQLRFFVNGIEAMTSSTPIWTQDRDVHEVCLDVQDVTPHTCYLAAGWNLISWNVDTDNDDVEAVFGSIGDQLETVMGFEQGALTYDVNLPQFSDLWTVDHLSAYWVKVSDDVEFTVNGTPVPASSPIPVTAGWNLVSYLPETLLPTTDALQSISENLIVALGYDGAGLTYVPGQGEFNDLTEFNPCFGYWVKVSNDDVLIYPGDVPANATSRTTSGNIAAASASKVAPTTSWINLYAYKLTFDNQEVKAGSEINAYTTDGALVGSFMMKKDGQFGFMPVYGDDLRTTDIDGVKSGEQFTLTVDGVEAVETFTWTSSGEKIEIGNLSSKVINGLPTTYGLGQNYPNPFNPTTTISFDIPKAGAVKLEIFNMLGQLVATPYNGAAQVGTIEIEWDATDNGGNKVASGIYLYRLTADNFTETKKMTLLK